MESCRSIGKNVVFGHNCIIEANVQIGDNTYIDSNTIVRNGTQIGENSFVGANCIIGEYLMDFCVNALFLEKCKDWVRLLDGNRRIAMCCCQNYGRLMHLQLYENQATEIQQECGLPATEPRISEEQKQG